jgi:hypothetical protein
VAEEPLVELGRVLLDDAEGGGQHPAILSLGGAAVHKRLGSRSMRGAPKIAAVCAAVVLALCVSSAAAAAPLSIKVEGNHFVNGDGQTIRLLGVNHPSFEYACVDGFGYNDGHMDAADAAAVASWNANAVRVPLNEDCWLGINGQPNSNEGPPEPLTAAGYRAAVESYVAALNAHGIYAVLDLHWSAPGNQVAEEQQPMPDADHSSAFWSSVAGAFKSDPAVVFDLFNEPYDPTDPRSGSDGNPTDAVTWNCWDTGTKLGPGGGAPCATSAYDAEGNPTTQYQIAGMQTLLNAVRATGATQPVLVGGLDYANDLSGWLEHAPADPLHQEAASFHNYQGKACDNVGCWNGEIAAVAASVPVTTGEFDQDVCGPSNFDDEYMEWADGHGVGYLAWGWWVLTPQEIAADGCSAYYLLSDYSGTPASPNGTNLRGHLLALPAGGVTGGSSGGGTGSGSGGTGPNGTAPAGGAAKPPIKVLDYAVKADSGGKSVIFTIEAGEACKASLSGQSAKPIAAAGHKPRKLTLGSAHFSLAPKKPKTVVLKLSSAARRALAAGSLRASFTLSLSGGVDAPTAEPLAVTLKKSASGHRGSHQKAH